MKNKFNDDIMPVVMNFMTSTPISAVKNGFIATMALTIVGSIFLLIARFPYLPVQEFLESVGITTFLMQAYNATFNMLAIVAVFSISYFYTKKKGHEPLSSGILGLVSYLLLIDYNYIVADTNEIVENVIALDYLGARGMIASIIIGLTVGMIYTWFLDRKITIKMPDSVPEGIANSFAAIIPGAVIISFVTIIFGVLNIYETNFIDLIYTTIQTPLQGLTSSLGGAVTMALLMSLLWWFGIHGASIIGGIMAGILTANMNANQAIIESGEALTSANGHIVTFQFRALLLIMTGSGITIGIVLYFLFFAKSKQFKTLGKLTFIPAIFNINEPVLFGTPIVLNPLLFVPFVLVPVLSAIVSYIAMDTGLVPLMGAINPPWTTPGVISGLLVGGVRLALLQLVIVGISFVVYFPFIKKADEINYKLEKENA